MTGNEANLIPGMAIYWYDPKAERVQDQWPHVGVYLGEYLDPITGIFYTDASDSMFAGGDSREYKEKKDWEDTEVWKN